MSMSQEEIEALMNETADLDTTVAEESDTAITEDDNADIITEDDISALATEAETENIEPSQEPEVEDNLDDILAGIEGITDDETVPETDEILEEVDNTAVDESFSDDLDVEHHQDLSDALNEQINQGVYPLPVEKEHKVVNQLNEVAEDSELKATQIFDVLSYILDENGEIQKSTKLVQDFVEKQTELLEALSKKFPNVTVLLENLELAKEASPYLTDISKRVDEENNQIFVAMDLMQFHDINRQKIERVMSVIKKLTTYLNGIFEDDSGKPDVQIAKHISGDGSNTVSEDDLESLISEFSS